ncbi:hypothetical protein GCM10023189_10440 [Nibrella saemangeumensis]|uniref:Peptidase C1A papain C-terminal domain-containing protein n=1 Tax=Nibrella saemangeumensis TaxID=1084526 RepID=A0ABP8MGR3_9BACT
MTSNSILLRRSLFILVGLLTLAVTSFAQPRQYKLGLRFNDQQYLKMPKKARNIQFKGILPSAYSLANFMPSVGDQGEFGTCVAWASAYYMRTIMQARQQGLSGSAIDATRFSPAYLYERIKLRNDNECQGGATLVDALDVMKKTGNMLLSQVSYPQCGADLSRYDNEAAQYRIEGYATLFDILQGASTEKIGAIKAALAEGENAVVIGMQVPRSFIQAGDTWRASPGETPEASLGGHAMTVIGYDDNKNGGSFLIVNSWGTGWGNKGYTWGNYEDVVRFTRYAFQTYSGNVPNPAPSTIALQSGMDFTLRNGAAMPVYSIQEKGLDTKDDSQVEMITYRMSQPYVSGTQFKMAVNNNKQAYMYIIGSDDVYRTTKLFPYSGTTENISPIVPQNSNVMLPASNRSFTMDNQVGNDYFLVLVADKELNFEEVVGKIKAAPGDFKEKVYSALGSELIAPADIQYEPNRVAFQVKGNPKGSIVPLLVMIEHK